MNKFEILKIFQNNLTKFMEALSDKYDEPDFKILKIFFKSQIPIEDVMIVFSERILPHASKVETENETFFVECTDLFEGISNDKVHYFKDLWMSPNITESDKKSLWKWFKLFLKLSQKYQEVK